MIKVFFINCTISVSVNIQTFHWFTGCIIYLLESIERRSVIADRIDLNCSEKYWDGKNNDLSAFGCDMDQWHTLKVENQNRNLNFILDEKSIFTAAYTSDIGNIVELGFIFKGSGSFKDVSLKKPNGEVVYKYPH